MMLEIFTDSGKLLRDAGAELRMEPGRVHLVERRLREIEVIRRAVLRMRNGIIAVVWMSLLRLRSSTGVLVVVGRHSRQPTMMPQVQGCGGR